VINALTQTIGTLKASAETQRATVAPDTKPATEEEKAVQARLLRNANIVLSSGKKAVIALAGRGVGPEIASRILATMTEGDAFYRDIKAKGITVWGAAIDTLENTSRFAKGGVEGPMTVLHLFNQPVRIARPYEGYIGTLFLPREVEQAATRQSILLNFRTPRSLVLKAIELAYPGIPILYPLSDRKYTLGIFAGPSLFLLVVIIGVLAFLLATQLTSVLEMSLFAYTIYGVAITPVTLTGSGGAGGPYTFSAAGLPSGLSISSSGTISSVSRMLW
jgi:hypothetical protein